MAQDRPAEDAVTVTAQRNRVDKSYRRMVAGMDLFEKRHALAPKASLRFKLLPRKRETNMEDVQVEILGDSFETPVEVAPDHTFTLPRDRRAIAEDASVRPNRKKQTMTWRSEIRTPGLPAGVRRLGDLRLECAVGMEAGLISNERPVFGRLASLFMGSPDYCTGSQTRYLFFAERPVFAVAMVAGARRQVLPIDRLYMGASYNPEWKADLAYCDCEVLLDRAYTLPLGDASWPDDTLIEFQYMDDAARVAGEAGMSSKADVLAALGAAARAIDFDSGYEVWIYQDRVPPKKDAPPVTREFIVLFAPSGVVAKTRIRG